MNLYTRWRNLSENHGGQQDEVKFWEDYLRKEMEIYNEILNNKTEVIEGKVSELASKHNLNVEYYMGFIDGISDSLKTEINLEEIQEDTNIKLDIDWEKLYYNMVHVEAHWLYNLEGWKSILSEDLRNQIERDYKASKTIVKETKIGRNDPCPCGSGKKFKKCCGN